MSFSFHNPQLLWLLALLPILALLKGRTGRSAALVFSSVAIAKDLSANTRSSAGRFLFLLRLLALAAFIVALARPQQGQGHSETKASGVDIVLALDVSGSMSALDLATREKLATRMEIVRETASNFIEKRPNDRIGLVAFAREAYLVSPITLNHDWLVQNLDRLHVGVIESDATAIGAAISMSTNRLRDLPSKSRILILLTDGEENVNLIPPIVAAEAAKAFGIKIYTIAAGKSGRVPVPRIDARGEIVRDRAGNVIIEGYAPSHIDEETLIKVSDITGGKFFRATNRHELAQIYDEIDRLETTEVSLRHFSTYTELFHWPLFLGLILLALEQVLANTRYKKLP